MVRDGGDGWRPWQLIPRLAAGAISVPVVVGFVALGAALIVARSLREMARETWARVPSRRGGAREGRSSDHDAAA